MIKKEKTDIFRQAVKAHQKYLYLIVFLSIFVATPPVLPIVYMRAVFGPVINSQSVSFLFSLAGVLIVGLALNGVLEWIRERHAFRNYIVDKLIRRKDIQGNI